MFSAKTLYSGQLKALFEVLFSNSQTVCLTISKRGIFSETTTSNSSIICADLPAKSFDEFEFTFDEPLFIGLGNHVVSFFKSLRNKTAVQLSMKTPSTLDITCLGKSGVEDECSTFFSFTVFSAQNVASSPCKDYSSKPIRMSCSSFNSMCKSFSKSAVVDVATIDVSKQNSQLSFSNEVFGISKKKLTFGKFCSDDSSLYYRQFKFDSFARIAKISSFGAGFINIIAEQEKPLFIETESPLGTIQIYLSNE